MSFFYWWFFTISFFINDFLQCRFFIDDFLYWLFFTISFFIDDEARGQYLKSKKCSIRNQGVVSETTPSGFRYCPLPQNDRARAADGPRPGGARQSPSLQSRGAPLRIPKGQISSHLLNYMGKKVSQKSRTRIFKWRFAFDRGVLICKKVSWFFLHLSSKKSGQTELFWVYFLKTKVEKSAILGCFGHIWDHTIFSHKTFSPH